MKFTSILIGLGVSLVIVSTGFFVVPMVFVGRVMPGVMIDDVALTGVAKADLPTVLEKYNQEFQRHFVAIQLRGKTVKHSLGELGASVSVQATGDRIKDTNWLDTISGQRRVRPVVQIDHQQLNDSVRSDFVSVVKFPRDATLNLTSTDQFELIPGQIGEGIDIVAFTRDIEDLVRSQKWQGTIQLGVVSEPPEVTDNDILDAQNFATKLLSDGFNISYQDKVWAIKPFTIRRLITFVQRYNTQKKKAVLGLAFNETELASYLQTTISTEIDQEAIDARFSRVDDHVEQFATPQEGRTLNIDESVKAVEKAIAGGLSQASLVVDTVEPNVKEVSDINALGVGKLIATGETNFSGSPVNRRKNIEVGVSRYHGLLIPPGKEFSFDDHLGPVDGEHGFTKELVIKTNVTIPEFGGGLCQVSTTMFRAAVQAGLDITARRNHAYAVRYYGKPGFDATIYPPYTDFRFINNTPGYILIQARVDGNSVIFEFWGTDDGRQVSITGPTSYDWQPDGSVKATLTEHVAKADGSVLLDQTFYSRYKSPSLFPHVVKTDDPKVVVPPVPATPTPVINPPTNTNVPINQPNPTPAASAAANPA
jgi:vancomycin resistance protein YoaR